MSSRTKSLERIISVERTLETQGRSRKTTTLQTLARYVDIAMIGAVTAKLVQETVISTYHYAQTLPAQWGMNTDSISSKIVEYGPSLFALWSLYRIVPWSMNAANDFHKKHPSNGPFFLSYDWTK
jgi:hypothetical protein